VHYSELDFIPKYIHLYVNELSSYFDDVIIYSNKRELKHHPKFAKENISIKFEENEGYDFGMFYKAFQDVDLSNTSQIACVNDSNLLTTKLRQVFDWANNSDLDFWGLVDSYEKPWFSKHKNNYHLQSHFIVFNRNAIEILSEYLKTLDLSSIYAIKDKKILRRTIINEWEIGLTQHFTENNLKIGSFLNNKEFTQNLGKKKLSNITHKFPLQLLENGYPCIKVKALAKVNQLKISCSELDWEELHGYEKGEKQNLKTLTRELMN
jgi:lipopolysaccharide biosynthesis protein